MENACLTAAAAKPFRTSAFPTQFTSQQQQPVVLNEKEKQERFCLPKPRLETWPLSMACFSVSSILLRSRLFQSRWNMPFW
jgi:hypothetical protein